MLPFLPPFPLHSILSKGKGVIKPTVCSVDLRTIEHHEDKCDQLCQLPPIGNRLCIGCVLNCTSFACSEQNSAYGNGSFFHIVCLFWFSGITILLFTHFLQTSREHHCPIISAWYFLRCPPPPPRPQI